MWQADCASRCQAGPLCSSNGLLAAVFTVPTDSRGPIGARRWPMATLISHIVCLTWTSSSTGSTALLVRERDARVGRPASRSEHRVDLRDALPVCPQQLPGHGHRVD